MSTGTWTVLFYHHDCPKCQQVLPKYQQAIRQVAYRGEAPRVALIEMPPFGARQLSANLDLVYGRLTEDREWFVTTPTQIELRDGQVISVAAGDSL